MLVWGGTESKVRDESVLSWYIFLILGRQHLKTSLGIASGGQDNHMRALVLALISAHYVHTAGGHAREILKTCEQLAAGLGASRGEGNVGLRLWIGERLVGKYDFSFH
jgi:hypothetical protein